MATAMSDAIRPNAGPQEQILATSADIALYGGSAGGGKALAIDTLIPTPDGWATMGQLKAGDRVYSDTGEVCNVTRAYPVTFGRPCFAVEFSDGSEITADADHQWMTMTLAERARVVSKTPEARAKRRAKRPSRSKGKRADVIERNRAQAKSREQELQAPPTGSVRTTAQIADTLIARQKHMNHAVKVCGPLQAGDASLLIHPYVLGAWLGDGTRLTSWVCSADDEIVERIRSHGHEVVRLPSAKYQWCVRGLVTKLKQLGLFSKKWIPPQYLRASEGQRLELLRGLMDTDGTVNANGQCEFSVTSEALAYGARELLCSLGIAVSIKKSDATLRGRVIGPRWRMKFSTAHAAFHLTRKLERQKQSGFRSTFGYRYIEQVRQVASVPVRCIEVDSPSRLFLAGRTMIPTHNSYALLMEAIRNVTNPAYNAVIFRRTRPQIMQAGGLWETAGELYPKIGGLPFVSQGEWRFPSGASVKLTHMEHEKDKSSWDGSQIPFIGFDELIHFSASQFWYLLSRNRSTCGVRPYMRMTCNPDSESWVADLVAWWIDQDSGFPIPERSGVLRYFIRVQGELVWGDSWGELHDKYPARVAPEGVMPDGKTEKRIRPLSFTFVPARLEDNPILEQKDPEYRSKLEAQETVDRARLLEGNWKIRPAAGMKFPRDKWKYIDHSDFIQLLTRITMRFCRFWDKAATEGGLGARTAGPLLATDGKRYFVVHAIAERWGDIEREQAIKDTAREDRRQYGDGVMIGLEQEPGSGGKDSALATIRSLAGFNVFAEKATGKKHTRWSPLAQQQQAGNVYIVRSDEWDWHSYIRELDALAGDEKLDKSKLKDLADGSAGAFKKLTDDDDQSVDGELIASGDLEPEDSQPMTEAEIEELPDYLRSILESTHDDGRGD